MNSLVLCDDHPLLLRGVTDLLDSQPGLHVVATAEDGRQALRCIREHMPRIAVLDVAMPDVDGLAVLRVISRERWPVRVIFLTATITGEQIIDAIAAGIAGIVLKESAPATLVKCIRTVADGGKWLPTELVRSAITRGESPSPPDPVWRQSLTQRETEVIHLITDGHSNKRVASTLGMSEGTVKVHLHNIYTKLGVDNRTALAAMFIRRERS